MNRTYSLKRHKEFRFTYRTGKRVSTDCFTLVTARNRDKRLQVGFSVSKKVGNAVERNRCKRRLKACFSGLLSSVKQNGNLIFVAKREALDIPFSQMQHMMEYALKKANMLIESDVL